MDSRDDRFIPASVDEQVDQLSLMPHQLIGSATSETRLVYDLHSVSSEYTATRDRVWGRLLAHAATATATDNAQPPETKKIQKFPQEMRVSGRSLSGAKQSEARFNPPAPAHYPKRAGLSLVAAAFVTAVLVGSMLLVLSVARHQQMRTTTGVPPETKPAFQPFCSEDVSWNKIDPGWYAICSRHQEQVLDISKTISGNVITIEAAYADANRVIITYTIQFSPDFRPPALPEGVSPMVRSDLSIQHGRDLNGLSGIFESPRPLKKAEGVVSFDTSRVPANTDTLNLHLKTTVSVPYGIHGALTSPERIPYKEAGTFTSDFSVPFHSSVRVANVNQTVTVGGVPVTLERVVVSSSQTRLYLKGERLQLAVDNSPISPYYLAVGDWHLNPHGFDSGSVLSQDSTVEIMFITNASLFDEQGEWIFRISSGAVVGGRGTWTFHFIVPA